MENLKVTIADLNKMFNFIKNEMNVEQWYDIKTEKQLLLVEMLFENGEIPEVELSPYLNKIRKIDADFLLNCTQKRFFDVSIFSKPLAKTQQSFQQTFESKAIHELREPVKKEKQKLTPIEWFVVETKKPVEKITTAAPQTQARLF